MRTAQTATIVGLIAAATCAGCLMIIATDTGYHDEDYDDCDRCHQVVVTIATSGRVDTSYTLKETHVSEPSVAQLEEGPPDGCTQRGK